MGKKWKNAPVMYTIAQVKFNQILTMEALVPTIQDNMRAIGFPDYRREIVNLLNIPVSQPDSSPPIIQTVNRHVFGDINSTCGFNLENNGIAFQAADYDVFETFLDAFLKGISIIHENVKLSFIERIGIRYFDAVMPRDGEKLSDYLVPQVLGLAGKITGELSHSYTETVSNKDKVGVLIARTIIRDSKITLPPEIAQLAYALLPPFSEFNGLHAVIDTDGYYEKRELFDITVIANRLNGLHEEISRLFSATASAHALNIWEGG